MTEENNIIDNNESNNETEEKPIKKGRGRPRKPDELKNIYVPHPRIKKEKPPKPTKEPKPPKEPKPVKEKKVKPPKEPHEKLKPGRKTGMILNPDRHREDGTYITCPLDPEYYRNYYHQVIKKPYTCPHCNLTLASSQKVKRHEATGYCTRKRVFKNIPDVDTMISMLQVLFPDSIPRNRWSR